MVIQAIAEFQAIVATQVLVDTLDRVVIQDIAVFLDIRE